MTSPVAPSEVERFRNVIGRLLGLHIDDGKLGFLGEILSRRIEVLGQTTGTYLFALETEPAQHELATLAQELTVGETYFYRNHEQFDAFVEICLPDRRRAQAVHRRLRMLSAGCATGDEAYTLAMLVREHLPDPSWNVSILGVDLNPVMIEKATLARYSSWSLRETPPEIQRRWFRMVGREALLDESIKSAVQFEQRNLVAENFGFWMPESYDVIFCRNVLMYFTPDHARVVIGHIARALAPGGYLFLGHAETLREISVDFHLRHTHGTFYYQRRGRLEDAQPERPAPEAVSRMPPLMAVVEGSQTWVEAIRHASERVQELTAPHRQAQPHHEPSLPSRRLDLGVALELVQQERFSDALTLVEGLSPDVIHDPDVLLLRAALLTHGGQPREGEKFCQKLLEIDELNAGAHYVLALCREEAGDRQGAVNHDQMAVYLDRAFAMPRLHLGMLARKQGDRQMAHREFEQALILLQREDASRLLLFGGGFGREALLALCRAELNACAGRP